MSRDWNLIAKELPPRFPSLNWRTLSTYCRLLETQFAPLRRVFRMKPNPP